MSLVIVGSLAFDTINTPDVRKEKIIGGSCSFAAMAAAFFTQPQVVAGIEEDFPQQVITLFEQRGIDTQGITREPGQTFHWEGSYGEDPNLRTTVKTDLNVFQDFKPGLLPQYRSADIVFLGNIDPDLQDDVLRQVDKPRLIAMDTINLWINIKLDALLRVLQQVDIFFVNDEEVKMITGEKNLIRAGKKILDMGPSLIVIKKGEHGALLLKKDFIFYVPAYPCEQVIDPTGAGDSFGGGFLGYLDKVGTFREEDIKKAAVYGSAMASFTIEKFSIDRLKSLTHAEIDQRFQEFKNMVLF